MFCVCVVWSIVLQIFVGVHSEATGCWFSLTVRCWTAKRYPVLISAAWLCAMVENYGHQKRIALGTLIDGVSNCLLNGSALRMQALQRSPS